MLGTMSFLIPAFYSFRCLFAVSVLIIVGFSVTERAGAV